MNKKQVFKLTTAIAGIAILIALVTTIFMFSIKETKDDVNINFEYSINYQNLDKNSINTFNTIASVEDNIEIDIVDIDLYQVAEYKFNSRNKNYSGEIYANNDIDENTVIEKLTFIEESVLDGTYFIGHNVNNNSRLVGTFNKDANWYCIDERKIDVIMDYGNRHYGDYSEWRSIFKLTNTRDYDYYAHVNESYITPDGDKTDYRSEKLIYKFNPTLGAKTELRDYAPKMKGTERSVSYAVSAGGSVDSDGKVELSSNISTSYTTLEKSPSIKDNGNMLRNYGEIAFTYLKPYDNKGQFYDYNISQSYQSSSFVIRAAKNTGNIKAEDNRTVGIVRDAVWSNKLVNFNINTNLTIYR